MIFSAANLRRAIADYERFWSATDENLYDLCRRFPSHGDRAGVNAKLWIIGRTYATGIERKIPANGKQGGTMSQLAAFLVKHARPVDDLFGRLRRISEPLNPKKLRDILDLHGRFMALIQSVVRPNQSPRSFASKYMHFHCPTVPIIDTYAVAACQKMIRWQKSFTLFELPSGADEYYARYVLRFWRLYVIARDAGLKPTVKQLDHYLLSAGDSVV